MTTPAQAALEEPLQHVIDPDLQKQLLEHAGKWVAITRSELIAIGDTPIEALKRAREKFAGEVIVHHVPANDRTAYFF